MDNSASKRNIVVAAVVGATLAIGALGAGVATGVIPTASKQSCPNCGVVESVDSYTVKGEGSGAGAVAGGLVGGVVGHQIGSGRGQDLATVAGAVGGAVAGHQMEKSMKKSVRYRVNVRLENGAVQTLTLANPPGVAVGDHVKLVDGQVVRY